MPPSYFYLLLLCLLSVITYLDRVCISVAGPRMQDALHLTPQNWGWVGTAFLLGYALFEIPGGHLGDRIGARRVLTRIVIWWSVFTSLTGAVSGYFPLLATRFLFGAGEAGAYPNGSVAIVNWFSPAQRGRAFGLFIMSSQIGGALAPLLVLPIQQRFGWRMSFYLFGVLGLFWAALWYWKFRDQPSSTLHSPSQVQIAFSRLLSSRNLWAIMLLTFGYVYTMSFYQTWIHTYLVKGRGFNEKTLALSALPYFCGAGGNLLGGLACDWLVRKAGLKWSRRGVGMAGLLLAAFSIAMLFFAVSQSAVMLWLSLAYTGITFQQPAVFAACLDIGGSRGGAVSGFMNMAGQLGGAVSSAVFGYMVQLSKSYSAPLVPMAVLLLAGSLLWLAVDVSSAIDAVPRARPDTN